MMVLMVSLNLIHLAHCIFLWNNDEYFDKLKAGFAAGEKLIKEIELKMESLNV